MKTKPIIHPDVDPYVIILLLLQMELYIVKIELPPPQGQLSGKLFDIHLCFNITEK